MFFSNKGDKLEDTRFFSLSTPNLESQAAELARLRAEQSRAVQRANEHHDEFHQVMELRDRISHITRRNKHRSILVIPYIEKDNPLVDILLHSNSNAQATFARGVADGLNKLRESNFDMVYLVLDFAREGQGACFLSADHPADAKLREENLDLMVEAEAMREFAGDAEIIMVCGTAQEQCPLARRLFELEMDQRPGKELV